MVPTGLAELMYLIVVLRFLMGGADGTLSVAVCTQSPELKWVQNESVQSALQLVPFC